MNLAITIDDVMFSVPYTYEREYPATHDDPACGGVAVDESRVTVRIAGNWIAIGEPLYALLDPSVRQRIEDACYALATTPEQYP